MPWKEETIMSRQREFIIKSIEGKGTFKALCEQFKISRKTGYRLLKRYQEEGNQAFTPRSKRPLKSPNQTNPIIEEQIVSLRIQQPTWGARKLAAHLLAQGKSNIPSHSTITNILKRHNLISFEDSLKRQKLIRFEKEEPNELWQMDFKGRFKILTQETCHPLTIIDDCSRFSLAIKACKNERFLTVKNHLIKAFQKYGLPKQINVDNGTPWGNSTLLPHTALTIWLMRHDIRVSHSRPRHPQTNGKCERFHRTLKEDVITRTAIRTISHAQKCFDKWREHYNTVRPHEALGMAVPSSRYQASKRQLPNCLPPIEYEDAAILRKVRGNGYLSFRNKEYLVGKGFKNHLIEIKIDDSDNSIALYFGRFQIYTYDL
jgi:transposase InsO family protein